jgi:hypothetical protein
VLLLAVFTTLLTSKVNIITLGVATCLHCGGHPQVIQLLQKCSEITVPNNSQVVNLLHVYIYLFSFENIIMYMILLICG